MYLSLCLLCLIHTCISPFFWSDITYIPAAVISYFEMDDHAFEGHHEPNVHIAIKK